MTSKLQEKELQELNGVRVYNIWYLGESDTIVTSCCLTCPETAGRQCEKNKTVNADKNYAFRYYHIKISDGKVLITDNMRVEQYEMSATISGKLSDTLKNECGGAFPDVLVVVSGSVAYLCSAHSKVEATYVPPTSVQVPTQKLTPLGPIKVFRLRTTDVDPNIPPERVEIKVTGNDQQQHDTITGSFYTVLESYNESHNEQKRYDIGNYKLHVLVKKVNALKNENTYVEPHIYITNSTENGSQADKPKVASLREKDSSAVESLGTYTAALSQKDQRTALKNDIQQNYALSKRPVKDAILKYIGNPTVMVLTPMYMLVCGQEYMMRLRRHCYWEWVDERHVLSCLKKCKFSSCPPPPKPTSGGACLKGAVSTQKKVKTAKSALAENAKKTKTDKTKTDKIKTDKTKTAKTNKGAKPRKSTSARV